MGVINDSISGNLCPLRGLDARLGIYTRLGGSGVIAVRSVLVLMHEATEPEVAAYLDRTYPSEPRPSWVLPVNDGPALYIDFYRDLRAESELDDYADLTYRFSGEPSVAVMADVSGRIPGDEEAFAFVVGLLHRFTGAAMDEYSSHLWTLAELQVGHLVSGHRFFDYNG